MKKLPEIFHNPIDKEICNNDTVYYCTTNNVSIKEEKNVEKFIDKLFKENGYIFNKPVLIKTKDRDFETAIIKKYNNRVITLSEDIIYIDDIISIRSI